MDSGTTGTWKNRHWVVLTDSRDIVVGASVNFPVTITTGRIKDCVPLPPIAVINFLINLAPSDHLIWRFTLQPLSDNLRKAHLSLLLQFLFNLLHFIFETLIRVFNTHG